MFLCFDTYALYFRECKISDKISVSLKVVGNEKGGGLGTCRWLGGWLLFEDGDGFGWSCSVRLAYFQANCLLIELYKQETEILWRKDDGHIKQWTDIERQSPKPSSDSSQIPDHPSLFVTHYLYSIFSKNIELIFLHDFLCTIHCSSTKISMEHPHQCCQPANCSAI